MTTAGRPRRVVASLALLAAVLLPSGLALAACGGSNADLTITVKPKVATQQARPGSEVAYVAEVVNHGPGATTGVTVRVDLPTAFRYQATTAIDGLGPTTRTQPSDPAVDAFQPQWGQWSMGAPGINADGTPARATLDITFTVLAAGKPGDYTITPHVFSEGGDEVVGKDLGLHLYPASDLSLTVVVDETTAKRGDLVHYHLTVLNRGSGVAQSVGILVTLPSALVFNATEHVEGNFSRSGAIDPIPGALVVYYGGYTVPPSGDSQPGTLAIVFTAKVLPTAQGGRYTASAQLTDADGAVVTVDDTAPVTVKAPLPTPAPSPTPSGRATFRATPAATPTPTPRKHG
jgi:uncharacterized repeat protein (TIGR01451 family)